MDVPAPVAVLCFGEALVDRLGPPGGDPASGAMVEDRLGGAPANAACALARLGTPVAFLGRLGSDAIGTSFDALFAARGVDRSAVQWDAQRPSRIVLVRRDAAGDRQFQGFAGDRGFGFADQAIDATLLANVLHPLLRAARWLLVGTIPLAGPQSAAALELAVGRAAELGVALAVDINWRPTFWDPSLAPDAAPSPDVVGRMRPLLERAALIKCAAEEARWLFGSTDPSAISVSLPAAPDVLVTDGARPLRWSLAGSSGELPSFPVPVVDTTGAGDAFTAGLLHGLVQESAPLVPAAVERLMRFASACGALVCLGAGAIDPQPDASAVEVFLSSQGVG